jgi:hypothetical protein
MLKKWHFTSSSLVLPASSVGSSVAFSGSYVRFLPNDNTSQKKFFHILSSWKCSLSLHGKFGCSTITSFLTEDLHPPLHGEDVSKMKVDYKHIGFLKTSGLFFSPGLIPLYSFLFFFLGLAGVFPFVLYSGCFCVLIKSNSGELSCFPG